MNIDYHALLPINGKKFSAGNLTAVVVNIPGPTQDSNNILYLTRFEGSAARRMLNLWVAEETLRLNPNAHRDVFNAVVEWLKTDEGLSDAPHRFFDETQQALIPYVPGTGPLRRESSVSGGDRLRLLLDGLKPIDKAAIRLAWDIQDENTRIDSLIDLAQELPSSQAAIIYLELMETILKAPNVQYRKDKIGRLVPHLPAPLLSTLAGRAVCNRLEMNNAPLFSRPAALSSRLKSVCLARATILVKLDQDVTDRELQRIVA